MCHLLFELVILSGRTKLLIHLNTIPSHHSRASSLLSLTPYNPFYLFYLFSCRPLFLPTEDAYVGFATFFYRVICGLTTNLSPRNMDTRKRTCLRLFFIVKLRIDSGLRSEAPHTHTTFATMFFVRVSACPAVVLCS